MLIRRISGANRPSHLWMILLLMGSLFMAGCATTGGGGTQSQGKPQAQLDLFDSISFDSQLSNSLSAKLPMVTVRVIAPFTANNIPERIDKWMSAVRKYDGKIELKPDPDYPSSRSFGMIFDLLKTVFNLAKDILIYSKAENYNLDLYYKDGSGEVTKFVFVRKEGVSVE
jgi:hypothetical protein